ncbi:2'-5' RNA ligase family protein [Microbacterium flavum]|uniref:2'-5' RNA ligase family protein n=1 Tax=Microbacterium flavum TaxID=415216 RepID=A0ABS5XW16_9MICO|nr:2'-5' RNA ligase family protein [Microbacterium flavum]MBT8798733.1 2'-5' RNA ligase family protein [Microbacterium flavum]
MGHPNTGHVTIRGFSEPDRVDALKQALATWAEGQTPIHLSVEAIDGFPPPFQIVIARLEPTPSLVARYASLTSALDSTDFHRIGELPLDEWVFHLSLIYAGGLDSISWETLCDRSRRVVEPRPKEVITSADFVWYANGTEYIETLPFGAPGQALGVRSVDNP